MKPRDKSGNKIVGARRYKTLARKRGNAQEIPRGRHSLESGKETDELRATMSLARLQMRTDKFQARNLVAAVYSRFTEGFATADLIAAKSLLDQLKSASSNTELLGRPAARE